MNFEWARHVPKPSRCRTIGLSPEEERKEAEEDQRYYEESVEHFKKRPLSRCQCDGIFLRIDGWVEDNNWYYRVYWSSPNPTIRMSSCVMSGSATTEQRAKELAERDFLVIKRIKDHFEAVSAEIDRLRNPLES